jgi:hypothetical protein
MSYMDNPQLSAHQAAPGAALTLGQLAQLGQDGRAYPVVSTDFVGLPVTASLENYTSAPLQPIFTKVDIVRQVVTSNFNSELSVVDSSGNFYIATTDNTSSSTGFGISKFNATFDLVGYIQINSGHTSVALGQLELLRDGNIAATWNSGSGVFYAVISQSLRVIKAATQISGVTGAQNYACKALSTGGFAVVCAAGSSTTGKLVTLDASGNIVTTSTTFTITASNYFAFDEKSDGTLLVAYRNTTLQVATYAATPTTPTIGPTSTGLTPNSQFCVKALASGFFGVATPISGNAVSVAVYSNAHAQQGSTYTSPVTSGSMLNFFDTDGTNFWLAASVTTPARPAFYAKITTAGASTEYDVASAVASTAFTMVSSGWDGLGNIVSVLSHASGFAYTVFCMASGQLTFGPPQSIAPYNLGITVTDTLPCGISMLGDGVWHISTNKTGGVNASQYIFKTTGGTIAGTVTETVAATATSVMLDASPGSRTITRLKGRSSASLASPYCGQVTINGETALFRPAPQAPGFGGLIAAFTNATVAFTAPCLCRVLLTCGTGSAGGNVSVNAVVVYALLTSGNSAYTHEMVLAEGQSIIVTAASSGACVLSFAEELGK